MWTDGWTKIKELGCGGQGRVSLVIKKDPRIVGTVVEILDNLKEINHFSDDLFGIIGHLLSNGHGLFGALKELRRDTVRATKNEEQTIERMKKEIETLQNTDLPGVIRVLDSGIEDSGNIWFVSEYCNNGNLDCLQGKYKGNALGSINALLPICESLGKLHKLKMVHRDIKPQNILVSNDGTLKLGDFGTIYCPSQGIVRLTDTMESIGTSDWMPLWAEGRRVDEPTPMQDVYSLVKVLYCMIAGTSVLKRERYKDDGDIRVNFKYCQATHMLYELVFPLSLVDQERNVMIPDCAELAAKFRQIILACKTRNGHPNSTYGRQCRMCNYGEYMALATTAEPGVKTHSDPQFLHNYFGLSPKGDHRLRIYGCTSCGHVAVFSNFRPNIDL